MVDVFGGSRSTHGLAGKRGPPGEAGPPGKRGKSGENSDFYSKYLQHCDIKWDIDFEPNFWIDGYDIQEKPLFKLLNKYGHQYDGTIHPSSAKPTKRTDLLSGRRTLTLDGTVNITCPMNWNGSKSIDNVQVFLVFKYDDVSGSGYRGGLFGNDNGGYDRFVALMNSSLQISGVGSNTSDMEISSFPADANPIQTDKFCVLSVHWNNRGESGCGSDKSMVYCNGKKLASFTAGDIDGDVAFGLGAINATGRFNMNGEIGRVLVCGHRTHPMNVEEIIIVHKYLMKEWRINEADSRRGPRGPKGDRGPQGPTGPSGAVDGVCRWMPNIVLNEFQKNEECCFLLSDPKRDLSVGTGRAYVTWHSRSTSKKDAVAVYPSKEILHISREHNALVFDKCLYTIDDVTISPADPNSYTSICITYQVYGESQQFLVSDWAPGVETFRGISVSNREIRIWGAATEGGYVPIEHHTKEREWTTLFVEWTNIKKGDGSFIVNDSVVVGTFTCKDPSIFEQTMVWIGGRKPEKVVMLDPLKGTISTLEIYIMKNAKENGLPESLKKLLISHQRNFLYSPDSSAGAITGLCRWMPHVMLKNLHEVEEQGCFVITDLQKDIRKNKGGEITEWISRSHSKINLIGKTPTKNIVKLPNDKGYALDFNKNHYTSDDLRFMTANGCGFLCVTFRTSKDEEQTLISNYLSGNDDTLYNEVSVSASTISINGFDKDRKPVRVSIQHDCRQWTTLYIDWFVENVVAISGSFMINNDRALSDTFNFQKDRLSGDFIDVGCRGEVIVHPFTGSVSALELYSTMGEENIPPALRDLVIENQLVDRPPLEMFADGKPVNIRKDIDSYDRMD